MPRFEALQALPAGSVCTQLKWRADERSVRARRILLHQVMLGASLTAMLAGAKSVRWRLTVADEMADEGRDALLNVASELSVEVAEETGLMLTDGKFMVSWAEEAAALRDELLPKYNAAKPDERKAMAENYRQEINKL